MISHHFSIISQKTGKVVVEKLVKILCKMRIYKQIHICYHKGARKRSEKEGAKKEPLHPTIDIEEHLKGG